ncbi:MAG: tetratricopeptide repeat protein [Bacteroidales bacterium]|nr:tetratricopeptide repeat protein [Bacteroidales bacterium]MDD4672124.1 tetratricopeptide repeat protein [Bacteroidales bacterium]
MLRYLFLFLIIATNLFTFGQNDQSKQDSLQLLLREAERAEKVDILLQLSEIQTREEAGLNFATDAYDLALSLKDKHSQAEALYYLGRHYYENYNDINAIDFYRKSLDISKELKDNTNIIRTSISIGRSYYYLDSLRKAESFAEQAIELAIQIGDRVQQSEALLNIAEIYDKEYKQEDALGYIFQALEVLKGVDEPKSLAVVYSSLGKQYYNLGEFKKSIEYYHKEIETRELIKDIRGLALSYYWLGRTHRIIGNFQLALEQYQKSLKYSEQQNDRKFIAINSTEIGFIYENLSRTALAVEENRVNYTKALSFHQAALDIYTEDDDLVKIAESTNNIANTYSLLATNQFVARYGEFWDDSIQILRVPVDTVLAAFESTFNYYNKALDIYNEIGEKRFITSVRINLGSHYVFTRNWQKANEHLGKGLALAREINSQYDIAMALFHYGDYYYRLNYLDRAEQYLLQSLKISKDLGVKDLVMLTHQKVSKIYEKTGNLSNALKHIKDYNRVKDELFSEQSQKAITEMQTKYETEKKEQEIKNLNIESELQHSVIQRQRLTIALAIGGIIVILAFSVLLINMVRQKQRANKILEEKNELISHQKQEITDSIRYASRIQSAILPSSAILHDALSDHFVLFLPRDIVSGDFYWFTRRGNKMIVLAADCTGHGVPGAFMSMLGVSFLYEIVNKEGVMEPAKILDMLRDIVKRTLSQTGKKDEQKDGMDISLSMLDMENMKLQWAGAYNPLILIRNEKLIEYKANKMPVAIHITDHLPFTNHEIELQPGDVFYMFSDGFADQFGGKRGKKYMSRRFKNLLLDIHNKPMEEQKELLHQEHLAWRGDLDQIDDIVIFGVRVTDN